MITSSDSKVAQLHDAMFKPALDLGLIQQTLGSQELDGRSIFIDGKEMVNFGSCSYLGLEVEDSLKQATIDATHKYGVQFSSSRIYTSVSLYQDLEDSLEQVFGSPVLVSGTTTLGHISYLPNLIGSNDAIILDHQVHASVQNSVLLLKANGVHCEKIRHSNLEMLDKRIASLKNKYKKIWYLIDGVYSMFGDLAPVKEIAQLLEKHEQLHLYVDDAHGMSWTGKNGCGYFLSQLAAHPKVFLTTSLCKGFGCGGGVLVLPDNAFKEKIRTLGLTFVFSGPIQPPILGACLASAQLHLNSKITHFQQELMDRIKYFILKAQEYSLPLIDQSHSPIFFIGCSKIAICNKLVKFLIEKGYYTNVCTFPAVPIDQAGVRITITRKQSFEDIDNMLRLASEKLKEVLIEENFSVAEILQTFKRKARTDIAV